ncbi:MAG: DUF5011 domain-containing protein [Clostridiales bacterium]|nr:DUF5011 domain-containing protein [Clostridiales bacterium]
MRYKSIFIMLAAFITLSFAALLFTSCSSADSSLSSYTVLSPTVNPGETLTGDDFIMVSEFASSSYTVTIDGDTDTDEPGFHSTTITVKSESGSEKSYAVTYTVRSPIYDSIRVEAGTESLTVEAFINKSVVSDDDDTVFSFANEEAVNEALSTVGTYKIAIYADKTLMYSSLIIEDTTPPAADPVTVYITSVYVTPTASDFVTNIVDIGEVTCEFAENYDFVTTEDISVTIILTDASGNTSEVVSLATCSVDSEAPVILGVHSITAVAGESIDYKDGVTVTDNSGENISVKVDVSRVDTSTAGTYEITYSATDSSGNTTYERASVIITDKEAVSSSVLTDAAKAVYVSLDISGKTKYEVAYAIYTWVNTNISYSEVGASELGFTEAAYDGLTELVGDSYTYMAVSEVLLGLAGIDTLEIERIGSDEEFYWLLVDVGDGWYHFDACRHYSGMNFECFMRTDAELEEYCAAYGIEYYYLFDESKYPTRATTSYYEVETEDTSSDVFTSEDGTSDDTSSDVLI